jgi:structure-specific recognition protein 1
MSKSIKQLTTMLSEVLSSTLEQNDIDSVMSAWNERKSDVSKLLDGATSGRIKRRKDPNAPKKWKTGYILFCVDQRDKLKSENESLSATEITSRLGALWKNLTEKDKSKYEVLSKKDKARYENDMSSYSPPDAPAGEEKGRRSRAKGERTGPKRPLSSYMYFCQDRRDSVKGANEGMNGKEITSELGRVWKSLSEEDKAPYEAKAATDKARFEAEKAQQSGSSSKPTKATKDSKASKDAKDSKASKDAKDAKASKDAKDAKASKNTQATPVAQATPSKGGKAAQASQATPVPPAKGAKNAQAAAKAPKSSKSPGFDCFCEEQTEDIQTEFPDWNKRKIAAELQKRWQELSPDDKEAYEMEAGDNLESEEDA